jgi:hypothetical protein
MHTPFALPTRILPKGASRTSMACAQPTARIAEPGACPRRRWWRLLLIMPGIVMVAVAAGATSQAYPRHDLPLPPVTGVLPRGPSLQAGRSLIAPAVVPVSATVWLAHQQAPIARMSSVEVELDIFSGRPNPRWSMRADQAPVLATLFAAAPHVQPVEAPGLGYRGFLIHLRTGDPAVPQTIRVYAGTLTATIAGGEVTVADERGLEQLLLADAQLMGYGPLIAAISPQGVAGATPAAQATIGTPFFGDLIPIACSA